MAGFTYLHSIIPNHDVEKVVVGSIVATTLYFIGKVSIKRMKAVPSEKLSLAGVSDFLFSAFFKYAESVVGKENRKHFPFFATLFFFIFSLNALGLVPGMAVATTSIWLNLGMALTVFFYFNYQGIKEHGLWSYIAHFAGPVIWLSWLIFPMEILSTCLRVFTLNLRLYWNMTADHQVISSFIDMFGWIPVPVVFYGVGLFVSFMQAFIFTTLTMIYVLVASSHEEESHA